MSARSERRAIERKARREARKRKEREKRLKKKAPRRLKELPDIPSGHGPATGIAGLYERLLECLHILVFPAATLTGRHDPFLPQGSGIRTLGSTLAVLLTAGLMNYLGMLLYYLAGGSGYFSGWYLFLIPTFSVLAALLAAVFLWGALQLPPSRPPKKRMPLFLGLSFPLFAGLLPGILYWLRLFWPQYERLHFYLPLPALLYAAFIAAAWFRHYYRLREWFYTLVLCSAVYLAALYFASDAAEAIVRVLKL